jgi:hypothetical protein
MVLEFLARAIRQKKRDKMDRNRKGRSQIISICMYIILQLKDAKDSIKKLLDLINTFSKVAGFFNIKESPGTGGSYL